MMRKILVALFFAGNVISALVIQGCTQMPTEKQSIVDMRPQISFKVTDESKYPARVIIDDLDMGSVGDYLENIAALRILSGNHIMRVVLRNQVILEEKFYAGDGVNRTFNLK